MVIFQFAMLVYQRVEMMIYLWELVIFHTTFLVDGVTEMITGILKSNDQGYCCGSPVSVIYIYYII